MENLTKVQVKEIETQMNEYKRKRFGYKTPNQKFQEKYNQLYV